MTRTISGAPKSKHSSISVSQRTYDRLKKYAEQQGVSITAVVEAFTADIKEESSEE